MYRFTTWHSRLLAFMLILTLFTTFVPLPGTPSVAEAYSSASWPSLWSKYPTLANDAIYDPANDVGNAEADITSGGGTKPSVQVAFKDDGTGQTANTYLFMRFRIRGNPLNNRGQLVQGVVLLAEVGMRDTPTSPFTHKFTTGMFSNDNYIHATTPSGAEYQEAIVLGPNGNVNTSPTGDGEYYVDIRIPLSLMKQAYSGVSKNSEVKMLFGSSKQTNNINMDHTAGGFNDVPTITFGPAKLELTTTPTTTPQPVVGQTSSYSLTYTVKNVGLGTATGVKVTDTLPAPVTVTSAPSGVSMDGQQLTWSIGDMTVSTSRTVTIQVALTPGVGQWSQELDLNSGAKAEGTDPEAENPQLLVTNPGYKVGPVKNPAPILTSVSPNTVTSGSGQFAMTLTGGDFLPQVGDNGSVVRVGGTAVPTTYISPTELQATIAATFLSSPSNQSITVHNPDKNNQAMYGGGESGARVLSVTEPDLDISTGASEVYVKGSVTLTASGGAATYTFTVDPNNSGATLSGTGASRQYTAGLTGGVIDTVKVTSGAKSKTAPIQVRKRPTKTEVTCTLATVTLGDEIECTATVTDTSGEAVAVAITGDIIVKATVNGTTSDLDTCTLGATCTVRYTPTTAGTNTISAVYAGSISHESSNSADTANGGKNQEVVVHDDLNLQTGASQVYVGASTTLTATGGNGTYAYSVETDNSQGAAIAGTTYTAGLKGGVTDTVKVTSGAQSQTAQIQVNKRPTAIDLTCTPGTVTVGDNIACTAQVTDTSGAAPVAAVSGDVTFTAGTSTQTCSLAGGACTVQFTLAAGNYTISAVYSETSSYLGSDTASAGKNQSVVVNQPSLTLTPAASQVYVGGSTTLTATGGDGTYVYSVETDSSQGATIAGSTYTAGLTGGVTDTVKVTSGAQSQTAQIQVNKRPTAVDLTCTPGTVTVGDNIACTAQVTDTSGAAPIAAVSGDVTFTAGTTTQTCSLAGGACTVQFTLAAGNYTISAVYSETSSYVGSDTASAGKNQSVAVNQPSLTLTPAASQVYVGASTTLTAAGGDGTYAYSLDTDNSQGATIAGTTYTAGLKGGVTDTVKVTSGAQSQTAQIQVNKRPTAIDLTCTPGTVTVGDNIACTAQVTDTSGAAPIAAVLGAVTFTAGTSTQTCSLAGGACTVQFTLAAGNYTISAVYSETSSYLGSDTASAGKNQSVVVNHPSLTLTPAASQVYVGASTTLTAAGGDGTYAYSLDTDNSQGATIAGTTYTAGLKGGVTDTVKVTSGAQSQTAQIQVNKRPTAIDLTCTPGTVTVGDNIACTAQVTDSSGAAPVAAVSGDVTFTVGTSTQTCSLAGGACTVQFTLAAGNYTISAVYSETSSYVGSDTASAGKNQSVVVNQPSLTLTPAASQVYVGASTTLTAAGGDGTYVYSLDTDNSQGATIAGSTYTAGLKGGVMDTVKVTSGAQSQTAQIQVNKRPTAIDLTCTPATVTVGDNIACTAQVTDTSGAAPIAAVLGAVTFTAGTSTQTCSLAGGACTVQFTLAAGNYTISAVYSETSSYLGSDTVSAGKNQSVVVNHPSLTLTPAASQVYVGASTTLTAAGGDGTYAYSLETDSSQGATIAGTTYTAGLKGGVTDTVKVTSGAQSQTAQIQVNKRPTAIDLTCTPATVTAGDEVACTVQVTDASGAAPIAAVSGDVTFTTGTTTQTCSLAGGACTVQFTLAAGNYTISAVYSETSSYLGSDTASAGKNQSVVVNQPSLTLTPAASQVYVGASTTLTATGGDGTYAYSLETDNSQGATIAGTTYTAGLTGGVTDTVKVTSGAQSQTAQIQVNKRPTAIDLTCTPGTVTAGDEVACTVQVTDASGAAPVAAVSGDVTFTAGTTTQTCSLAGGACTVQFTLAAGNYAISAVYSETSSYVGSDTASAGKNQSVVVNHPSLTLTPAASQVYVGASTTLTATGGDGTYAYSVETDSSQGATIAGSTYTAGLTGGVTDTVKVTSGDNQNATAAVQVNKRPTKTEVVCTPTTATVGDEVECTVTVTDTSGETAVVAVTGDITVKVTVNGITTDIDTCTAGAACTAKYTPSAAGTYTIAAVYAGSDSHLGSDSNGTGGKNQRVDVYAKLSLTPAASQVYVGASTTLTATGGDGTYAYSLDTDNSQGATIAGTRYTAGLTGGVTDTVKVTSGAQSKTAQIQVNKRPTKTEVVCTPTTATVGDEIECTVTVTDTSSGAPTLAISGDITVKVTVNDITTDIDTCTAGATCTVKYTPATAGTYTISADYAGSDSHLGSDSNGTGGKNQQVDVYAKLSLTPAASQVYVGASTTLTATGGDGTYAYSVETDNSQGATIAGTTYTAGLKGGVTDTVKVTSGDNQAATTTVQVNKRPTMTAVTCNFERVGINQPVACTATVSDTSGAAPAVAITGDVTLSVKVGDTTTTLDPCTLNNGACTVQHTPTATGTYTISAVYGGSDSYLGSTSSGTGSHTLRVGAGIVDGTVKTEFGTTVAGITVTLFNEAGDRIAETVTGADGSFAFNGLLAGDYTVKVINASKTLAQKTATVPEDGKDTVTLVIASNAELDLTADPEKIVGDGISTSQLKAILWEKGTTTPISGISVTFATTAGTLQNTEPQTKEDGTARATLKAPRIEGASKQVVEATVTVQDVVKGLFAQKKITITFLPPIIEGVVLDNGSPRKPVQGAKVTVREVSDRQDRFEETAVTDDEGYYLITIPRGNVNYEVIIEVDLEVTPGVRKKVTSTQSVSVGNLTGTGEEIPVPKTVNGVLVSPNNAPDNWQVPATGLGLTGTLRNTKSGAILPNPVTMNPDGTFQINDVPIGTYDLLFQVEAEDAEGNLHRLVAAKVQITVGSDGELSIASALVDPFGIVKNDRGQIVSGARVELKYAADGTKVVLPPLAAFPPSNNANEQYTNGDGEYAWMVFPSKDYYIVATAAGHEPYDSRLDPNAQARIDIGDSWIDKGIIHVENTIVRFDFVMKKLPDPPAPPAPAPVLPAAPTTTAVQGVVVDTGTGRPVANATVAIPDLNLQTLTGADGTYQLTVPQRSQSYTLQVTASLQVAGKTRELAVTQTAAVPAGTEAALTVSASRKIAGQLFYTDLGGTEPKPLTAQQAQALQATIERNGTPVSTPVIIGANGQYTVDDLTAGTYRILFRAKGTDGRLLAVTNLTVPLMQEGQLGLQATVVAPFATVTDAKTGTPLPDVLVSLFWDDTTANRGAGREPGSPVNLPGAPAFFPHGNANPQQTNNLGRYGWLCLPQGDVYLIAKKDGYLPYDSRIDNPGLSGCLREVTLEPMKLEPLAQYKRYIMGYPDGTFKPENPVTRAEVATIFARLIQSTMDGVGPAEFKDLPATHWAARHINLVMERGLMNGYPDGTFHPDSPITRAELATVVARFRGLTMSDRHVFQDTRGHWAEPAVTAAFEAGIVLGFADNTFGPTRTTTRAELVAMVNRMLGWAQLMTGRTEPRWPDVPFTHWAVRHVEKASISHTAKLGADQRDYLVEELQDRID